MRDLIRLRCGDMKERNKYWLDKEYRECAFCGIGIVWNIMWRNIQKYVVGLGN